MIEFTSAIKDQSDRGLMRLVEWKRKKSMTEEAGTTEEKNDIDEGEEAKSVQDSDRQSEKEEIEQTGDDVEQVEDTAGIEKETTAS